MEQNSSTIFTTINQTAKLPGLSRGFIRQGCREGRFPCIRVGEGENATYKLHFQKFVEQLEIMTEGSGK